MNMFALWVIGRDMERILGPARFTAVYLVGLLGGSVSVLLFGQVDSQTVGASGAVFALMGGLLVLVIPALHRSSEWQGRACLPDADFDCGQSGGYHDRGSVPERHASRAGGMDRGGRCAVRLLSGRPDNGGRGITRTEVQSVR